MPYRRSGKLGNPGVSIGYSSATDSAHSPQQVSLSPAKKDNLLALSEETSRRESESTDISQLIGLNSECELIIDKYH